MNGVGDLSLMGGLLHISGCVSIHWGKNWAETLGQLTFTTFLRLVNLLADLVGSGVGATEECKVVGVATAELEGTGVEALGYTELDMFGFTVVFGLMELELLIGLELGLGWMLAGLGLTLELEGFEVGRVVVLPVVGCGVVVSFSVVFAVDSGVVLFVGFGVVVFVVVVDVLFGGFVKVAKNKYLST